MDQIHNKDCIQGMKELDANSIDCCVTSPPYFGLRDYGTDGQIGLEATPELFVAKMVEVFTEVKRVLKPEGTLWLNLGDSYNGSGKGRPEGSAEFSSKQKTNIGANVNMPTRIAGLKPKDLIGIPWMVAFALRSSGWYLRQDIIWHKPNPMPESVTDRCTKSHEYIFLMSKSAKYYYDHECIKVDSITPSDSKSGQSFGSKNGKNNTNYLAQSNEVGKKWEYSEKANKRSVWTVTTKPYSESHFATFPEDLIVDMIKAGCPENGTVLDPFMGAGTTGLVAKKLNRNYIGYELNENYITIANKRISYAMGLFL